VHRDVAPVTKLASSSATKTVRDALSSGLQILLGDGGRGGAVQHLFITARLKHLSLPCSEVPGKILPASYIKANTKIRSVCRSGPNGSLFP
jgi:hypothetical protein